MKQDLTRQQYDKLKFSCETNFSGDWKGNRKFVRRGRSWAVIAFLTPDGLPLMSSYKVGNVRIEGKQLAYKNDITNPSRPEPFDN